MHPCPGNWVAIGRAVVNYAYAAHTFSAGIKYEHSRTNILRKLPNPPPLHSIYTKH